MWNDLRELVGAYKNIRRKKNKASLVAQMVKNLPAVQDTRVRSLSQEDPLEKEMVTHSSILAWKIPCTEEPGKLQSIGPQESDTTERLGEGREYY